MAARIGHDKLPIMGGSPRKIASSRVVRPGQPMPVEDEWLGSSVEERIAAVWELTRMCYAWNKDDPGEPRLQRAVSHVQRARR
jgi:hypothetical protein